MVLRTSLHGTLLPYYFGEENRLVILATQARLSGQRATRALTRARDLRVNLVLRELAGWRASR
jgi:hypothetical protein